MLCQRLKSVALVSPSSKRGERGTTLIELLVVLAIVSVLAVTALPFAEVAVQRRKETELRDTLREVRMAIDAFHIDWRDEEIPADDAIVSQNGFPVTLSVLVTGLEGPGPDGGLKRYLRRLPENPFADADQPQDAHWDLLGYTDPVDAASWNGEDVYDLRPNTDRKGLDGTEIATW